MSSANIRVFTTILDRFLGELTSVFPDDTKLSFYSTTIRTFLGLQPQMVLQYFHQFVTPLHDRILAKDATLWKDDLQKMTQGEDVSQDNLLEALRIRDLWHQMSDATRENVWKYLALLLQAAGTSL